MKQHITVEQMKQVPMSMLDQTLCEVGFNELTETISIMNECPKKEEYLNVMASFVTIGKMIEILDRFVDVEISHTPAKTKTCCWYVDVENEVFFELELVNALWEAVKYVLGKE